MANDNAAGLMAWNSPGFYPRSCDTNASGALGVVDDNALYKSPYSLTHTHMQYIYTAMLSSHEKVTLTFNSCLLWILCSTFI